VLYMDGIVLKITEHSDILSVLYMDGTVLKIATFGYSSSSSEFTVLLLC
jgi:hypothetical protein